MSAPWSVLFLCQHGDECCPFLVALRAAGFSVRVAQAAEDAKLLLSEEPVGLIAIHHDDLQGNRSIAAELKEAAPRTPLILLRRSPHPDQAKPLGIDTIYDADPTDMALCTAVARFLWLNLKHCA